MASETINRAAFDTVARYYDELMSHVNYPGWVRETRHVAACLGRDRLDALDLACGTGTFAVSLARKTGWHVVGLDSSVEMVRHGRAKVRRDDPVRLIVADMQRPPLRGRFDIAVSLFDSVNFVLTDAQLCEMFHEVHRMLVPDGLFFFDIITERNVKRGFQGEPWAEPVADTTCTWSSTFDTDGSLVYTTLDIRGVATLSFVERLYSDREIRDALTDTGFDIVAVLEAHTWDEPGQLTERIEYIACRCNAVGYRQKFVTIRDQYISTLPIK